MTESATKNSGESVTEGRVAYQNQYYPEESDLPRAAVVIGEDTAVATAEQLLDYTGDESAPEVIHTTTIDSDEFSQNIAVCAITPFLHKFLRYWANLEYGPEVNLEGTNVPCFKIKGWKAPTKEEIASRSPLSNPKIWADASKAYAAGYRHVLPTLPLVVEDHDQVMPISQLQKLIDRPTVPETFRVMTIPQDWDDEPSREISVCIVEVSEERLLYNRTELDPLAPSIQLRGKKVRCLKVKGVKPVASWSSGGP